MRTLSLLLLFLSTQLHAELTVYTSRNEHLVKDIFKAYEKESGVKVNYRTGKAGALIQTIKAEDKNSPADIFMTVDAGNLWYAKQEGVLQPTKSEVLTKNIPAHLRDKNNNWFGLSVRARTIAYNPNKVKDGELVSYEDLANEKWKGRLCLRTSKKVYNQSLVAMLIDQHGYDKAKEIVSGWVKNNVEIFSNDTAVLKAVAAGQCAVGIVNTYYFGRLVKKENKLPLKLFWPNQNADGVHVNVSGAGIVKTSKHVEQATKFLEWLSSKNAQGQFASVNYEYPANPSIDSDPFVKSWGKFKPNNKFQLTKAGILQKQAIKLMNEAKYK